MGMIGVGPQKTKKKGSEVMKEWEEAEQSILRTYPLQSYMNLLKK